MLLNHRGKIMENSYYNPATGLTDSDWYFRQLSLSKAPDAIAATTVTYSDVPKAPTKKGK